VLVAAEDLPRWPDRPPSRPFPRPRVSKPRVGQPRGSKARASQARASQPSIGQPSASQPSIGQPSASQAGDSKPEATDGRPSTSGLHARLLLGSKVGGARVSHPARKIAVGASLLVYCWFAAGTVPFTRNALLIVLAPGAVAGVLAFGKSPRRIPPPVRLDVVGFSYWGIAVTVLLEWEASAFKDGASWWHPALTTLIDPTLGARPVKAMGLLLWLLAGWGLLRR
jgi:hypothetical protein